VQIELQSIFIASKFHFSRTPHLDVGYFNVPHRRVLRERLDGNFAVFQLREATD
jgi:hypothetical protein